VPGAGDRGGAPADQEGDQLGDFAGAGGPAERDAAGRVREPAQRRLPDAVQAVGQTADQRLRGGRVDEVPTRADIRIMAEIFYSYAMISFRYEKSFTLSDV
jgi:hypothetical protein